VALVISVTFLASAAASMVGRVAQLGALSETARTATSATDPNGYFVDTLFRSDRLGPESKDPSVQAEAGRIFANALRQNQMPTADQTYLARLVAARTGISQSEAEKRVTAQGQSECELVFSFSYGDQWQGMRAFRSRRAS
jgi:hypothetical protein